MRFTIYTANKPCAYLLKINTIGKQRIVVSAKDHLKPCTYYFNQTYPISGQDFVRINLPQSPEVLYLDCYNEKYGNMGNYQDKTFIVGKKEVPLETKMSVFDFSKDRVKHFILFAQEFSDRAAILSTGKSVYISDMFRIDYLDYIYDDREFVANPKTGILERNPNFKRELTTPARIQKDTGRIEISKKSFLGLTVPQRFVVLCHEFAHFFYNKKQSSEEEADFNALLMALGLGYPRVEILTGWCKVFIKAVTPRNVDRYIKIKNFINRFDDFNFKIVK